MAVEQMPREERRTTAVAITWPENLPGIICACQGVASNKERGNPTTNAPIWESRQATQDAMLRFSFSLKRQAIVHSFAGMRRAFSISGMTYFL
jgi:hypothetical protein